MAGFGGDSMGLTSVKICYGMDELDDVHADRGCEDCWEWDGIGSIALEVEDRD